MVKKDFVRQADGIFKCLTCQFITPHENKIQRHMVKSHGFDPYPEPPVLAEKWLKKAGKGKVKNGNID